MVILADGMDTRNMACLNQTPEETPTYAEHGLFDACGSSPASSSTTTRSAFRDGDPDDAFLRIRAAALLMSRAGINVVMAIDVPIAGQWPGQPCCEAEGPDEWVI